MAHHIHPHHVHHGAHAHIVHPVNGGVAAGPGHHRPASTGEFLQQLTLQSPLDVYDIHETGWRRALLLAKRDRHEYLVRYIGWDSKWDEWIRGSSGRLAPSNSKTASLAYTGFKGPKSADEVASLELGRDWNSARQEGVMCDVLFAIHVGNNKRNGMRLSLTPMKSRSIGRKDENEFKTSVSQSAPSTPATSPMVRGLSGLGIISPRIVPTNSPQLGSASPPVYFSAHSHIIQMRCPDLLKNALISLPPIATFEDATNNSSDSNGGSFSRSTSQLNEERKEETGGRSLADQEQATSAAATASSTVASSSVLPASSILNYSLTSMTAFDLQPSTSPELSSVSPATISEEKACSLDDDDENDEMADGSGGLNRSQSFTGAGFSELHPGVTTYDIACIPNAATMQNLLTYIYTGDLSVNFLPSIRHVFELATAAHLFHLDRLLDLCAIILNRMLVPDNFLLALRLGLHFQNKVLGNLDTILSALQDAGTAATQSLTHEIHNAQASTFNSKIHSQLSPLIRVCFEFLMTHWDLCWAPYENIIAFQSLPQPIFQMIMRLMPMKNIMQAPFTVIYPTVHPQSCNLTAHFKHLYEERTEENTDFRIIVANEDDETEHVIHVHKAVLAARSEYFRALFRCSFEEGKDNCVRLDATQHNPASMESLVKYLYSADLKVDPHFSIYLSNCTDFFGLSSNALEHACQELVSQHHCLKVLKSAWKSCNEGLFKRACKFIDWTTLATLMNPRTTTAAQLPTGEELEDMELGDAATANVATNTHADDDQIEMEDLDQPHVLEHDELHDEDEPAGATVATATSAASATGSPASSSNSTPFLTAGSASPASPAIDASDVEMWKAIVMIKANPASSASSSFKAQTPTSTKRARPSSSTTPPNNIMPIPQPELEG